MALHVQHSDEATMSSNMFVNRTNAFFNVGDSSEFVDYGDSSASVRHIDNLTGGNHFAPDPDYFYSKLLAQSSNVDTTDLGMISSRDPHDELTS